MSTNQTSSDTLRNILRTMDKNQSAFQDLGPEAGALRAAQLLREAAQQIEDNAAELGTQFTGFCILALDANEDVFNPIMGFVNMRKSDFLVASEIAREVVKRQMMGGLELFPDSGDEGDDE